MSSCSCFVFFFQAEDGIRDYKVTGVQTCALPISGLADVLDAGHQVTDLAGSELGDRHRHRRPDPDLVDVVDGVRSEERRVGKECRSRWWPNDSTRKRRLHAYEDGRKLISAVCLLK